MTSRNNALLVRLAGGDRRSTGMSNTVVSEVLSRPALLKQLTRGLLSEDPVVRMRAADALEKATTEHPQYLQPFKAMLLQIAATSTQKEIRWHLAQMLPRLNLTDRERRNVITILERYLLDESSIVRTFSLQSLADLSEHDRTLRLRVKRRIGEALRAGTPAMKSRARKILVCLNRLDQRGEMKQRETPGQG